MMYEFQDDSSAVTAVKADNGVPACLGLTVLIFRLESDSNELQRTCIAELPFDECMDWDTMNDCPPNVCLD